MNNNTDWITVVSRDEYRRFVCNRCDGNERFELPMSMDEWIKASKLFIQAHKDCKPKVSPVKESVVE